MNLSAKTLWIQNATSSNVCLHLHQLRSPASPSFRRGVLLMPINVPAGGHYDVCKGLSVPYDEAERIVDASPEFHLHRSKGRIYKLPYPPEPVKPAAAAPVETYPAQLTSFTPVGGETVVYDPPIEVQLKVGPTASSSGGPVPPWPKGENGAYIVGADEARAEEDAKTEALLEPAVPQGGMLAPDIEEIVPLTEPSMDWSEDQLRAHAEKKGIDLTKLKSKTAVLRAIRRPAA